MRLFTLATHSKNSPNGQVRKSTTVPVIFKWMLEPTYYQRWPPVYQDKTVNYKQLCIACGFLELDCSRSSADIFLLEIPKTLNNQCFFQLLHQRKTHNMNWSEKCLLRKPENCILLFEVVCHNILNLTTTLITTWFFSDFQNLLILWKLNSGKIYHVLPFVPHL